MKRIIGLGVSSMVASLVHVAVECRVLWHRLPEFAKRLLLLRCPSEARALPAVVLLEDRKLPRRLARAEADVGETVGVRAGGGVAAAPALADLWCGVKAPRGQTGTVRALRAQAG